MSLDRFAYFISHDMRAPLRAIQGYSRVLEQVFTKELQRSKDASYAMEALRANCRKLEEMIDDLTAFSRQTQVSMACADVNMQDLAEAEISELFSLGMAVAEQDLIEANHISNAWGDPSMLRLVWRNLLDNACKYTSHCNHREIQIQSTQHEQYVTYTVRDNGVGLSGEDCEAIFHPFERGKHHSAYPGTGLGLALCQTIVTRHGGRIWAEPNGDTGAAIHFTLPYADEAS